MNAQLGATTLSSYFIRLAAVECPADMKHRANRSRPMADTCVVSDWRGYSSCKSNFVLIVLKSNFVLTASGMPEPCLQEPTCVCHRRRLGA